MNMDYLTGMMNSPNYEFPYSGAQTSSLPFLNYNPSVFSPNMSSPLDSFAQRPPLSFPTNNIPPFNPNPGNNTIIYQIPGNVPLDLILRQLGVDVNSLSQTSSRPEYRSNTPISVDFVFPPPRRPRRRRIVCREVTDSETDDGRSHSSRYHRRDRQSGSPTRIHQLLSDIRKKGSEDVSQPNSIPNANSLWQTMQNMPQPGPPQDRGNIGNVWNRAASASNQKSNLFSGLFNRTSSSGGAVLQPPPGVPLGSQPNQGAARDYIAARDTVARFSDPDAAVANVWSRADNAVQYGPPPPQQPPGSSINSFWSRLSGGGGAPPPQQPPPAMNSLWNQMSGGGGAPPPQQPPPAMNSLWNQMSGGGGAPPPQQLPPAMNPPWNQMSGGGGAPPPQQPSPAMNPLWNQMSGGGAPPPQQPPPAVNSFWSKMSGSGAPPPQYPPSSYPPMNTPQQGSSSLPPAFNSLFSRS